jgi:dihydroorotate dehydrogenase electron transfer subunit
MTDRSHRGTIFLEDAEVVAHEAWPGEQFVLTLRAPRCAAAAEAGSFAHLTCDPGLPMRRPLSIMQVDREAGTVRFLYKIVGQGLRLLAARRPGEVISMLGPIGVPFRPDPTRPRCLLLGGGVGIPPMVFLADRLRREAPRGWQPLVLMGSEVPFPFELAAAAGDVPGLPGGASASLALLTGWGVPSRLTSLQGYEGCHRGYVTDLARHWLDALTAPERAEVSVYACGPTVMLEAAAALAAAFDLPCQVSLEEYMACAVGGCAGCAVAVRTPAGVAMKRVCVDGPVFDARTVFPPAA